MEAIGNVIIVIHLMVVIALVAVVLLQRSEGGALGIGGGNAFMTTRGQGNVLTRATGILAAVFFATSIGMTVISRLTPSASHILDTVPTANGQPGTTAPTGSGSATSGIDSILKQVSPGNGATTAPAAGTATTPPADSSTTTTPPPADTATTAPAPAPAAPASQVPTSQ
jgi:preprotein translocase subunit SecG